MTNEQEEQLIIILSDFIPVMDGDRVVGVSPNARDLTRQKVLEQLEEEQSQLPEGDPALLEWEEENIELLKMIADEEFQAVLTEKILLTEIQIGQSIFQPLTTQQLSVLAEKLQGQKEKSVENSDKQSSIFKNIFGCTPKDIEKGLGDFPKTEKIKKENYKVLLL